VGSWYNQARHRAIANQHHANLGASLPFDVRPVTANRKLVKALADGNLDLIAPSLRIDLPEGFLASLSVIPGDEFGNLSLELHEDMEQWWGSADPVGVFDVRTLWPVRHLRDGGSAERRSSTKAARVATSERSRPRTC
jgi:hypothetical protein